MKVGTWRQWEHHQHHHHRQQQWHQWHSKCTRNIHTRQRVGRLSLSRRGRSKGNQNCLFSECSSVYPTHISVNMGGGTQPNSINEITLSAQTSPVSLCLPTATMLCPRRMANHHGGVLVACMQCSQAVSMIRRPTVQSDGNTAQNRNVKK